MTKSSTTDRAIDAIRSIVRALHVATKTLERRLGLSGAQLDALEQLDSGPAASLTELAERTGTHQSTASVVVSRLVDRRLVTREPVSGDKRRLQVALTSEGRTMLDTAPPSVLARLRTGFAQLGEQERVTLAALLERWLAAAGLRRRRAR